MILTLDELRDFHEVDLCSPFKHNGKTKHRVHYPEAWKTLFHNDDGTTMLCETFCNSGGDWDRARTTWLWSDLHFGHRNIIRYADRPFKNTDEMREALISNHNELVDYNDVVICVGDFAFLPDNKANAILHRLNGYKILVVGNHDLAKGKYIKNLQFNETHMIMSMKYQDVDLVFTHYPMNNLPEPYINIHGHEHIGGLGFTETPQHFNVNCEFHDYKPIRLDDVVTTIRERNEL